MNALNNARQPGESYKNYRARRKLAHRPLANVLSGRFCHVATKIVTLPPAGADEQVDKEVERGLYRDLVSVMQKDGKEIRVGRTKGETYLHPTKIKLPDVKRRQRREQLRDTWREAA